MLRELVGALKNRSFRFLFIGIVFFFVMRGIQSAWGFTCSRFSGSSTPKRIEGVQLAMVLAFAFGVPIWTVLSRRLDKKPTLIIAMMGFSIFNLIPPMAEVLGFLAGDRQPRLVRLARGLHGARRVLRRRRLHRRRVDARRRGRRTRADHPAPPGGHLLRRALVRGKISGWVRAFCSRERRPT